MAKSPSLDYEASVPLEDRTHVSVTPIPADNAPPPFRDYIPSKNKSAEEVIVKKSSDPAAIIVQGADYVPGDAAAIQRSSQDEQCKAIAKEMYESEKSYRNAYRKAEEIVKAAPPEKLENPGDDKELLRAIQIVRNKRKPLTAEDCIRQARARLVNFQETKDS